MLWIQLTDFFRKHDTIIHNTILKSIQKKPCIRVHEENLLLPTKLFSKKYLLIKIECLVNHYKAVFLKTIIFTYSSVTQRNILKMFLLNVHITIFIKCVYTHFIKCVCIRCMYKQIQRDLETHQLIRAGIVSSGQVEPRLKSRSNTQ